MTVIQRNNYISTSNCDAMLGGLPSMINAAGKEYRSPDDKSKISVYQLIRYYSYDDDSFEPMNEIFSPIL